ncbi:hypothetical protein DsansV1_C49g0244501 [Dioscorea sansibarensis]
MYNILYFCHQQYININIDILDAQLQHQHHPDQNKQSYRAWKSAMHFAWTQITVIH